MNNEYSKKMLINAIIPIAIFTLAAINSYLSNKGLPCLEIGDDTLTQWVSNIVEYVAAVWCWWKNNNVTPQAQQAQDYLNELKNG